MKVNFDTELKDIKGDPIKDGDSHLKLGTVVVATMFNVLQEDANVSAQQKVSMFKLAQKADAGGEQEITSEDVTLIKNRAAKMYGALVVGRVVEALEG